MNLQLLNCDPLIPWVADFYRRVFAVLREAQIRFLVGGGFGFYLYTGIARYTKDLDIFLLPADLAPALEALSKAGYETQNKYPHWLAKVYHQGEVVDLIFGSGNGICPVDGSWFLAVRQGNVLGETVSLVPIEEMIWQKAFIMERHRYDGSDILLLLHRHGDTLDWDRLLRRFGDHRTVLLSHLLLYQFAFPDDRSQKVGEVLQQMLGAVQQDLEHAGGQAIQDPPICRGTLLSLLDYLPAIEQWGYRDARIRPLGNMTEGEVTHWTNTFER